MAADLNSATLLQSMAARARTAIRAMLASAVDARFQELPVVTFMLWSAMGGATSSVLQHGAPDRVMRSLRKQVTTLCTGYLRSVALPRRIGGGAARGRRWRTGDVASKGA